MTRLFPVIIIIMLFLSSLPGCGTGESTPRQAAERFVSDLKSGTAESAWQNLSDGAQKRIERKKGDAAAAKDALKTVLAAEGAAQDLSTTKITGEKIGRESTRVLSLVKQKNGWKIDSCASSGNQEGPHE